MERRAIAAAAVMLMASACSGGGDGGNNSSAGGMAAQPQEPLNLTVDPNHRAVPVTLPSPTPIAAVPSAFDGRWGMVGDDCNPAKAAIAKGLMVIAGDRVTFYESRGIAHDVRQLMPRRIGFTLAMSGEGREWREPTTLALREDGRSLLREARGSADRRGSFTYQKCPA